jgi:anti-sigma B factor antagonist
MSAAVMRFDGELTIYRAAELKPLLLALPAGDAPIQIDLAQVSEIDTAGVQLLLLSRREAESLSRPWQICAASSAVGEALGLLGLRHLVAANGIAA